MEGEIDFDPLTAEEEEDVNKLVDDNSESLLMKEGETYGRWYNRLSRFLGGRRQAQYGYQRLKETQEKGVPTRLKPPEEYEMTQPPSNLWVDETTLQMKREGLEKVKKILPRFNEDKAVFRWGRDEYGREILEVGLRRKGAQLYTLIDGEGRYLRSNLPETLQKVIGNRSLQNQKAAAEEDVDNILFEIKKLPEENQGLVGKLDVEDDDKSPQEEADKLRAERVADVTRRVNNSAIGEGSRLDRGLYDQELLDSVAKVLYDRKKELEEMRSRGEDTTSQEKILIKDLQAEIATVKENEGTLGDKVLEMTNDLREALNILDDKTQELEDVKAELEEAKRASKDNKENMAAIESLQRMKENAEEQVKEYQDKLEKKEQELSLVIKQKNLAANYFDTVSKNVDAELKRLDIKVVEGENRQTTIEHLQDNFELLLRKLSETEKELKDNKEKLAEAEKNNEAPAIIEDLQNKIEELKKGEVKTVKTMNDLNDIIKQQKLRIGSMFKEMQNSVANFTEAVDVNKQLIKEMALKNEKIRQLQVAVDDYERTIEELRKSLEDEGKTEEEKEAVRKELERLTTARDEKLAELKQEEREREYTTREKIKRLLKRAGLGVVFAGAVAGVISLIMNIINPVGNALKKVGKKVGKELKNMGKKMGDMGKKMAASIPGLLGSALSLILKTGGELLKFLGNNIWILVVALGAVLLKWMTEKR